MEIIVNNLCNVDVEDEYGDTYLYEAVAHDNVNLVMDLLEKNANPAYKCHNGLTPLHIACEYGNEEISKLLVNKLTTQDLNQILNNNKSSLLHSAAIGIRDKNVKCWKVLEWLIKEKEMNPFLENDRQQTARDILACKHVLDIYDDLLESIGCYT